MSEKSDLEQQQKVVSAKMSAEIEAQGISVASVKDGTVFYFSREFLEEMVKKLDEKNEPRALLFVKHNRDPYAGLPT